jgi:hypothetical protein
MLIAFSFSGLGPAMLLAAGLFVGLCDSLQRGSHFLVKDVGASRPEFHLRSSCKCGFLRSRLPRRAYLIGF